MATDRVRRVGAYAPLSTSYYKDDDVALAGEAAELLFVRGLAFCAEMLHQDGYISDIQVVRYVGVGMSDAKERAEKLVEVGLWSRVDGGYTVRSWLKWNKSSTEIGRARAADRDRKAAKSSDQKGDDTPSDVPRGFRAESARNPGGVRAEGEPESERSPSGFRSTEALQSTTQHTSAEPDAETTTTPVDPSEARAVALEAPREEVERLCKQLADRIEGNGSKRPAITKAWRESTRLLLDRDGRTEEQISRAIDWSQDHDWWRSRILSMPKLREKFDAMRLQAAEKRPNGQAAPVRTLNPRDSWKAVTG